MRKQPKLSIITINYNNALGLERTIKSVIAQTYSDIEYIVVDGASSDNSRDILDKYREKIDIVISEPDDGIYNAMNKGANKAHGEYFLFLNSGDMLYTKDTIKNSGIEKFKTDIVSGNVYNCSKKAIYLKKPPKRVSLYTFFCGSLPHPSSFIKKTLFDKVGGYMENYHIISDWCFFVDATLIYNCTYSTTDVVIAVFEWGGISASANCTDEKMEFLRDRFGRIIDDYLPARDEAISNTCFWIASKKGILGDLIRIPFLIINRLLRLRNHLSRRMWTEKVPTHTIKNDSLWK